MAFKLVATVTTTENTYRIEKDQYGLFWVTDQDGYCGGTFKNKKAAIAAAETDFLDPDDI